jgi:hypothetical protein
MAIEIRFISVVFPIDRINESRLSGGFRGLLKCVGEELRETCWHDDYLHCELAPAPDIVEALFEYWEQHELQPTEIVNGTLRWKDLCVIDYHRGLTLPCEWIRVDRREHVAWHANHARGETVRGDDTFPQDGAVFLWEMLRDATLEVVDSINKKRKNG